MASQSSEKRNLQYFQPDRLTAMGDVQFAKIYLEMFVQDVLFHLQSAVKQKFSCFLNFCVFSHFWLIAKIECKNSFLLRRCSIQQLQEMRIILLQIMLLRIISKMKTQKLCSQINAVLYYVWSQYRILCVNRYWLLVIGCMAWFMCAYLYVTQRAVIQAAASSLISI